MDSLNFKKGQLVKSILQQHDKLTTWRINNIHKGLSGKLRYFCTASHDTKREYGFDAIKHDFKGSEIKSI